MRIPALPPFVQSARIMRYRNAATSRSTRARPGASRAAVRRSIPALEALEGRVVLSTITVTGPVDDGNVGSLRFAINQVNLGIFDTIDFAFTDPNAHTIAVTSPLPAITKPVTINPSLKAITLDGTSAGANANGLTLGLGSDGSTVKGLDIENFSSVGIDISSKNNTIVKNFLGVDESGSLAKPNLYGIIIEGTATGNTIGGANLGNLISGNTHDGILVQGLGFQTPGKNTFVGNTIGLNAGGTSAIPNGFNGILLSETTGNTIGVAVTGGAQIGLRNVISGNTYSGIDLQAASSNVIIGNLIGTGAMGTTAVPNKEDGIVLQWSGNNLGSGTNRIGGGNPGEGNIVSGNTIDGITLHDTATGTTGNQIQGNIIGLDITGTATLGNGYDGIHLIQVKWNYIGTDSGNNPSSAFRNVISGNAHDGIMIDGSDYILVEANYIGTDISGLHARPNGFSGVSIFQNQANKGSTGNLIGGDTAVARNVISGNSTEGVYIGGAATSNNTVQGNFIGVDVTGKAAIGNAQSGIFISGSPNNYIGINTPTLTGPSNVISGNGQEGIWIESAKGTRVAANFIGTDVTGLVALGNGDSGIYLKNSDSVTIGPLYPVDMNVISGNKKAGIVLDGATHSNIFGNVIGSDVTGKIPLGNLVGVSIQNGSTDNDIGAAANEILYNVQAGISVLDSASLRNRIQYNVLFNSGPGIDLGGNGVTPNTPGGPHVGPNLYQNTPILTFAANGKLGITLNAAPSTTYKINYYSSRPVDPLAGPQAEHELGFVAMTTDAAGNAGPLVVNYRPQAGYTVFSATATDPAGNTSELSGTADPNPLKAVMLPASFTAGAAKTVVIAGVADLDPGAYVGRLGASVNWGDGSPVTGATLVAAGPGFAVICTHTYMKSGTFAAVVTVADAGLGVTVIVAGAVQVASPPITAFGRNFTLSGASTKFSAVVATFLDAGPALPLTSYVATIAWGDGTISVGKISGGNGVFSVQATRKFTRFTGVRTAAITIADASGHRAFAFDQFSFAPGRKGK